MLKYKAKFTGSTQRKATTELRFSVSNDEIDYIDLAVTEKKKGYLYFNTDLVSEKVEKIMEDRSIGVNERGKSPSQRLRGILYQYWDENIDSEIENFEQFYERKMDEIIEHFKSKLG
jgi:hypothetical protein